MSLASDVRVDSVRWHAHATVRKWDDDQVDYVTRKTGVMVPSGDLLAAHLDPYEVVESPGNLLTTAGVTRLASLLIAGGGQAATATSARLGVGNGSTAAVVADTDLSAVAGAANRYFMPMDATYPSVAAGVVSFRSTFASADGNFVWSEWGIDIGAPTVVASAVVSATLLNHKSSAALGTKTSGSWQLTATITLS